jgi:hypothetical protein
MTQSRGNPQTDRDNNAAAVARWDDEGGASKSFPTNTPFPGTTGGESSGTSATWFVPPIVVPVFFAVLIVISVIYQRSWQFLG